MAKLVLSYWTQVVERKKQNYVHHGGQERHDEVEEQDDVHRMLDCHTAIHPVYDECQQSNVHAFGHDKKVLNRWRACSVRFD